MEFDENLAAIHAYLCADGYVIRNPETQKHMYYRIGLRNTNLELLEDFQRRFESSFKIKPHINYVERCSIGSKQIYMLLTKDFSYYSYEWKMPKLNKKLLRLWLRAFFDCESWVEVQNAKSRVIGLECVNKNGLKEVQDSLSRFNIKSTINKRNDRNIYRLCICGKDNLKRFKKEIGFLHPNKFLALNNAISSYKDYRWKVPKDEEQLFKFVKQKGKLRKSRNQIRFLSIRKYNLVALKKSLSKYNLESSLHGPWRNKYGTLYYCLILKTLQKNYKDNLGEQLHG